MLFFLTGGGWGFICGVFVVWSDLHTHAHLFPIFLMILFYPIAVFFPILLYIRWVLRHSIFSLIAPADDWCSRPGERMVHFSGFF